MQLPHVSRGTHPKAADLSVLEHLLGEHSTVTPERGVFLRFTHRLHPEICAFCSRLAYDGRLECLPGCELQRVTLPSPSFAGLEGAGLRYVAVPTEGNVQQSIDEAETIAALITELLRGSYTARDGSTRSLTESDVLVVTPYNMQVRRLRQTRVRRRAGRHRRQVPGPGSAGRLLFDGIVERRRVATRRRISVRSPSTERGRLTRPGACDSRLFAGAARHGVRETRASEVG
jgi:hypothetical protein